MKIYVSADEIFIHHDQRSIDKYYPQLSEQVRVHLESVKNCYFRIPPVFC